MGPLSSSFKGELFYSLSALFFDTILASKKSLSYLNLYPYLILIFILIFINLYAGLLCISAVQALSLTGSSVFWKPAKGQLHQSILSYRRCKPDISCFAPS